MKKRLLFPLACSLLFAPTAANTANAIASEKPSLENVRAGIIMAGFLDDIKDEVEGVRDTVDTTNETVTDTTDAAHGVNDGVGNSQQIIKGGGESNDSEVIEETEVIETTEGQESEAAEATEVGDSF